MCSALYHYCSLETFLAVIRSREIWLTNIFCMNDSAEHYWLRSVAQDVLKRNSQANENLRLLESRLFPKEEDTDLYCCSLSALRDSLGQWRAYADDGRGVAIGLSMSFLRWITKKHHGLRLEKVVYERKEQEEIVQAIIAPLKCASLSQSSKLSDELIRDLPALVGKVELWFDAARCKNPCFREENEWRLIYDPFPGGSWMPMSTQRHRSSRDMLIPYYALPLSAEAGTQVISEIVFGPKNAYKHNDRGVRKILSENGYDCSNVVFRVSDATYR